MSNTTDALHLPNLYWNAVAQLKTKSIYTRIYRDRVARRVRLVELVKALSSSSAIAGWVLWKDLPFLWSGIIVASQLLDAIKYVFPFSRMHKEAGDLAVALDLLCIDAEAEWMSIYTGTMPIERIVARRQRLEKLALETTHKHFPGGFYQDSGLRELAKQEAAVYLWETYGGGPQR